MTLRGRHSLVVYRSSERAEATIRTLATAALERNDRITIIALAAQEQADEIVLADPGSCGLSRRDRRRLDSVLV